MNEALKDQEMDKIRLAYLRGEELRCSKCGRIMDGWEEEGPLFLDQVFEEPGFMWLKVECSNGHHGRTILGNP